MMRTILSAFAAWMLLASATYASGTPAVSFTKKPTAKRAGTKVTISFAVDRQTDVAVYILDAGGKVVRHLAAGRLGGSAPEPLRPGSLEQTILWDGRDDDGKPAVGGPFRVRVGLSLRASYAGMAFSDKDQSGPNRITSVQGMAAGRDGRLYVVDDRSGWAHWPAKAVHVFRRDGSYEKTIKPFPASLPAERVRAVGAFVNDRGYLNPLIHRALGMSFYPFEDEPAAQMAVTPGGWLLLAVVPTQSAGRGDTRGTAAHLAAIDLDGGVPSAGYAGPALGKGLAYSGARSGGGARLATSADGRWVYLVNIGNRYYRKGYQLRKHPVVYRAPLPAMGPAEVFFGDVDSPGADEKRLGEPMGLATDGKGHLLVADRANNRVVVLRESDAGFAGSFPVPAPEWIAVHPRTGAVYVQSKARLVRFSGWKDAKEQAALDLSVVYAGLSGWRRKAQRITLALDASDDPAVLWMGLTMGERPLQHCRDLGDRFSDLEPAGCVQSPRYWRPASDPLHRRVLCRIGNTLHILDEASGKTSKLAVPRGLGNNQGINSRLDRDGNVYSAAAAGGIWKSDAKGKRIPFPATASDPKLKGHIPGGSSGTTAWERDFYVDRRGDIYAKVCGTAYHGLMHVDVFGPDGALKRTVLWGVTDGAYGPRVDKDGNLYMMECVKPLGQPFPEEFTPHVTDRWVKHWYDWMYGSIVKFGPAGGNLWVKARNDKDRPRAKPVRLPDSFSRRQVYATFRGGDSRMQGALWMKPGVAHCGDMGIWGGGEHCHCTGCDFDVDDFGRSFAPDNGRQRVMVLDAGGNVILHIGAYGNQDYCGPDSYVLDPKGKFLRPRKADDPKGLVSPFAKPEIAFNWIVGLAVTDRYMYVADAANRRMLRVKLEYAAQEACPLPGDERKSKRGSP